MFCGKGAAPWGPRVGREQVGPGSRAGSAQ